MTSRPDAARVSPVEEVTHATQLYFDLLFTGDLALFDRVFHKQAWLFDLREGKAVALTADEYRDILAGRQSSEALGAPREDQIVSMDFSSPTHAFVKVQARINEATFIDYLSMLRVDEGWCVVSKRYHCVSDG
jgi:hypothetical protein